MSDGGIRVMGEQCARADGLVVRMGHDDQQAKGNVARRRCGNQPLQDRLASFCARLPARVPGSANDDVAHARREAHHPCPPDGLRLCPVRATFRPAAGEPRQSP